MAVPGDPYDAPLVDLHEAALERAGVALDFFDAHTHLGHNDPDGYRATPEEIVAGLDRGGQRRALIFPMQEPDGYEEANRVAVAAAENSDGRLLALARVDPNRGDEAVEQTARWMQAGAVGLKLHPRSDSFDLPHPVVERLIALAHEARRPVLFHAGRGFPGLGEEVARLGRRYPDARLILAHAGISDLGHLAAIIDEAKNLFFDTSWWQISDMLTLFTSVPPGRILYASDMPYGAARYSALRDLRCAFEVGFDADALRSLAGGQLERIVGGEDPIDLGPAPGTGSLGARDLAVERGIVYLATACSTMFRGFDPTENLTLARLALVDHASDVAREASALIEIALETAGEHPDHPRRALNATMGAQLVLGTPSAS
jgi:predicted TIM-barrel fold metal-dependent hydrolase